MAGAPGPGGPGHAAHPTASHWRNRTPSRVRQWEAISSGDAMKAIVYRETGPAVSMLRFVERPVPQPGPDEILVKIALSGINPIDYKIRRGRRPGDKAAFAKVVPHSDGAGERCGVLGRRRSEPH